MRSRSIAYVAIAASTLMALAYLMSNSYFVMPISSLETCIQTKSSRFLAADDECLKKTVHNILDSTSTAALLAYITSPEATSSVRRVCHEIAHEIGRDTFARNMTLENALAQCTNACRFGCQHGAIGAEVTEKLGEAYDDEDIAHAPLETIKALGSRYCADQQLCHGVGHILYISTKEYLPALETCSAISRGVARELCYQGIFMEAAGGSDTLFSTSTLPIPDSNDYAYPCNVIGEQYSHACFLYLPEHSAALFQKNRILTKTEQNSILLRTCERFTSADRANCFSGYGYMRMYSPNTNAAQMCSTLKNNDDVLACTLGTISLVANNLQYKEALSSCEKISSEGALRLCYNVIFQLLEYRYATKEQVDALCASAKEKAICAAHLKSYRENRANLPDYRFGLYSTIYWSESAKPQ